MSERRPAGPVLVLTIALAGAATLGWRSCRPAAPAGDGVIEISGVVEFRKIDLSFKYGGQIDEVRFDEGHAVRKGDLLARLDTAELDLQRRRTAQSIRCAESTLDQLETLVEYQRQNRSSQVMLAQANLAAAEARLAEGVAGSRAQQVEQARAAVRRAEIERDKLGADLRRAEALRTRGAATESALDTLRSQWESAGELLASAREQLALLEEGSRKETLDQLRAGVALARAQLSAAENLSLQVRKSELDLASARLDLDARRTDLALIDRRIADASLTAPAGGVILERYAETAEVVAASAPVCALADLADAWVRAFIPEQDLGRVRIGQAVEVVSDSYPDKVYPGTIAFISPEAEFTPKNVQTRRERVKLVYRLRINVDNASGELKLGMPVDARIRPPLARCEGVR